MTIRLKHKKLSQILSPYNEMFFKDSLKKKKKEKFKSLDNIKLPFLNITNKDSMINSPESSNSEEEKFKNINVKVIKSDKIKNQVSEIINMKKKLNNSNMNKSRDLLNSYSNYSQNDFQKTKYSEKKSFKLFYKKLHKSTEFTRKGANNLDSSSFKFIKEANNYKISPNPIGFIKRKGNENVINMNNKRMGDNYISALSKSLNEINSINQISLSQNRLTDIGITNLLNSLISNSKLISNLILLDISYNKLGESAIFSLGNFLNDYNCNLEHLNIEGNLFGNKLINILIKKMLNAKCDFITYINFGKNNINDDCSLNLALLVKKYIFLKVLILYQNNFKNYGMSIIMSEIKKHIYLKFLDISWNLIGTNLNENPPTQEELIKDYKDKNQKSKIKKYFNNALLEEMKKTLKFPKNKKKLLSKSQSLSEINSNNNNILSFTKELCELFKNKKIELLHLDISHNNLNYLDCKQIEKDVKNNHSILGIHVDGNNMNIDELGFIHAIDKSHYEKNYFASSQIFYPINNEHPLIKSNILKIKKIRRKNNCWICEGYREKYFECYINEKDEYESPFPEKKNKCFIHFNFENYKSFEMNFDEKNNKYYCYRMCPPEELYYFYSYNNNIYFNDNNEKEIINLNKAIIHEEKIRIKEKTEINNLLYLEDKEPEYINSKFIVSKVIKENIEINPQVIDNNYFINLIKFSIPRPEKKLYKKKREKIKWKFEMSIWAFYKYNYDGESEKIYNKAFEFDYQRGGYEKDKDLKNKNINNKLKLTLRKHYPKIINTYKYLSSVLGWKIWQIGQNSITEFAFACPNLLDNKYLINDVLLKVTEVKNNILDKEERKKKNLNIPDNIIRHQFMMLLVKISKDKYYRNRIFNSVNKAVEFSFENHFLPYLNKFNHNEWRIKRYYNEFVDNTLKAYLPLFNALYKSYSTEKLLGKKDSNNISLEEFNLIINSFIDNDFPIKEIPILFNLSLRLTENEIFNDKHYYMLFPEFLEGFCRFIDKLSPIPINENKINWNMEKRVKQDLYIKIENVIPNIFGAIKPSFKNLKDKFIMPIRDVDTGLLVYDLNSEFYLGLHPPKFFGWKKQ